MNEYRLDGIRIQDVADLKVKSLAEQSRQATNQMRTILGEVRKATAMARSCVWREFHKAVGTRMGGTSWIS